ncbi:MAG: DUF2071 domain-containing protein [Myxococcales bacterium]|nr:DUF2071 domain-containing protein [Myxococcales bacterium]MCB9752016.1 DUF2071 domain-containing protein [Myxococcales bacterium]
MGGEIPGRFLTAQWRYLAMLNYEVEPSLLRARVPAGTELDRWDGRVFISVVGFMFQRTRVLGLPIPFHVNFEEVNLRFYVRRRGPEGWRRGVVFIKELVPRAAIAWVARTIYNENYQALRMRHQIEHGDELSVEYGWRTRGPAGRWNSVSVTARGEPQAMASGTEAEFIAEHYWGYAAQQGGGCMEYRVEHPPWRVWPAERSQLVCDAAALYGEEFADVLREEQAPSSAFLAEGSAIVVRRGVRIEP